MQVIYQFHQVVTFIINNQLAVVIKEVSRARTVKTSTDLEVFGSITHDEAATKRNFQCDHISSLHIVFGTQLCCVGGVALAMLAKVQVMQLKSALPA